MRQDPAGAAKQFAAEHFSAPLAVVLGGSAGSGRWNDHSDLDVVAVLREEGDFFRKVFRYEGWRVECIIVTQQNYRELFDAGIRAANPSLQRMLAQGTVLCCTEEGKAILEEAKQDLEAGPMPLSSAERDEWRFRITDHVEDARGGECLSARWFAGTEAIKLTCEFVLRMNHRWSGEGKFLLQLAEACQAGSRQRIEAALEGLLRGDAEPLMEYCAEALAPYGGFLMEGYEE